MSLVGFLTNFAVPPAAVVLLARVLSSQSAVTIPTWILAVAALFSLPLAFAIRVRAQTLKHERDAAALGAVLPYRFPGKLPGNIDMMRNTFISYSSGYPGEIYLRLAEEIGPCFDNHWLYDIFLFTAQPEHIKAMLSTQFQSWEKGSLFRAHSASVLGVGVFNSDGEMWKFHRTMTRPFFSRDRISHFDLFDRHAETALDLMKTRLQSGHPIDFQDLISRFTLDSATEFLFGHCVDSLAATLPYPHNVPNASKKEPSQAEDFARAFMHAQKIIAERTIFGSGWWLAELFKDRSKPHMQIVDAYLNPILDDALKKHKIEAHSKGYTDNKEEIEDDETLLDHLIKSTTDRSILHDEIFNILVAGRDTTAAAITFVVYFLAMYPKVLVRLREEIMAQVGPSRKPTFEDIRDMKYLRAVINETLRLFPPVPFNIRCTVDAVVLPSSDPKQKPIYLPAGTPSIYSVLVMHRRKDLWGPDADEFDPDRFLDDRMKKYLLPNPFIFLPFNAGPRICLGQQFAYNEMSFFLIKLLQIVDHIKLSPDAQPPNSRVPKKWAVDGPGRAKVEQFFPKAHVTMYAFEGLWVDMNVVG